MYNFFQKIFVEKLLYEPQCGMFRCNNCDQIRYDPLSSIMKSKTAT